MNRNVSLILLYEDEKHGLFKEWLNKASEQVC